MVILSLTGPADNPEVMSYVSDRVFDGKRVIPADRAAAYPTPQMIAAGSDVIAEEYGVCGADIAPDLARDVFLAMQRATD